MRKPRSSVFTSPLASMPVAIAAATIAVMVAGCGSTPETISQPGPTAPATSAGSAPDDGIRDAPGEEPDDPPDANLDGRLERCADVPVLSTDVIGDMLGGHTPDDIFMGVLLTYAGEHPDTFGGLWIDNDAGGTIVMAFTDEPDRHREALAQRRPSPDDEVGVVPRPPIVDDRPIVEWDVPFDVVRAAFSEAALRTAQDSMLPIMRDTDGMIDGLGIDVRRNRVSIWLVDPTEDGLADLASRVPTDRTCVEGEFADPERPRFTPGDELDVIVDVTSSGPVTCAGVTFPLDALTHPVRLADTDLDGVKEALDQSLATGEGEFWPADGWFVASADDDAVTLVYVDESSISFMWFESTRAGWSWRGSASPDECAVRTELPEGLSEVEWELDPADTVDPDSTTLSVLATELVCASGRELGERLLGPQVIETDEAVLIAFAAVPLAGDQTCPSNPSTPVTVELSEPLGDREIRDGRTVAPDIRDLLP